MDKRIDEAKEIIERSSSAAIERAKKKMEKRRLRGVVVRVRKKSEMQELIDVYSFLYVEKFKNVPPVFAGRERSLFVNLIKRIGYDRAEKLIRYVFKNWDFVSREIGLSGAPVIGDIVSRCLGYAEAACEKGESKSGIELKGFR